MDEACLDLSGNYCLFPDAQPISDGPGSGARQGIIGNAERASFPWPPMANSDTTPQQPGPEKARKLGYVEDYVSGIDVRATPEELLAAVDWLYFFSNCS